MIQIEKNNLINSDNIYNIINIKTPSHTWIKRCIEYTDLQKNKDYFIIQHKSTGGRPKKTINFTFNSTLKICLVAHTKESLLLYKYISNILGKEIILEPRTRKEIEFSILLKKILYSINKNIDIKEQYFILDNQIRLDFFINNWLIIEYDEYYHNIKTQMQFDNEREKLIYKYFKNTNIKILRVSENEEIEGIGLIIKTLYNI